MHVPSSFSYLLLRDLAPFWPLYVTVSGVCMRVRISEIEFGDGRMGPLIGRGGRVSSACRGLVWRALALCALLIAVLRSFVAAAYQCFQ